ncbi:hypothetical protein HOM50_01850 [bacterium]|nr:hypothetical protein [bacterium]MBT5015131.1 hypothetical protein [bacterium]
MKKLMISIMVTLGILTAFNVQADLCKNIPKTIPIPGKYYQKTVPNLSDPLYSTKSVCVGGTVDC